MIKKALRILKNQGLFVLIKKTVRKIIKRDPLYEKYLRESGVFFASLSEDIKEGDNDDIKISVIVPLYNTPVKYLSSLIRSIEDQTYKNYEICFSDGSGENGDLELKKYLLSLEERYKTSRCSDKLKIYKSDVPLNISENTNRALSLSTGDIIVFMDHDDLLSKDALFYLYCAAKEDETALLFYSDEDKVSENGKYFFSPHFKPDINLPLLLSTNYICHMTAVRRELFLKTGGLRKEFDGAQDYDFILRCIISLDLDLKKVHHIKRILYHWRFYKGSTAKNVKSKEYAYTAGKAALLSFYEGAVKDRDEFKKIQVDETIVPGIYKTTGLDYKKFFNVSEVKKIKADEKGIIIDAGNYNAASGWEPPYDIKNFRGFDTSEYGYMNRLLCMRLDDSNVLYIP